MFTLTHDLADGEKVICKSKVNRKIKIYETCSQVKANVIFNKGKTFKLYAKRDIAAGEELYLYYGYRYWIGYISIHINETMRRLDCLMKNDCLHQKDDTIVVNSGCLTPHQFLKGLRISPYANILCFLGISHISPEEKANFLINTINE